MDHVKVIPPMNNPASLWISIAALFAIFGGGSTACIVSTTGAPCSSDTNCPTGQRCVSSLCEPLPGGRFVELPREILPLLAPLPDGGLATGLPIGLLDSVVLSTIVPGDGGIDAGSHIKFAIEFEFGPSLTMLRFPAPFMTSLSKNVVPVVHAFASPDIIPPLKTDNVMCATNPNGSIVQPGPNGRFQLPVVPLYADASADKLVLFFSGPDSGTAYINDQIRFKRLSATLSQLRINVPDAGALPPANSLNVVLILESLALEYQAQDLLNEVLTPKKFKTWNSDRVIEIDKIELSCLAVFGPMVLGRPPVLCGEIPLTCVRTSARVSGLRGTLPAVIAGLILPPFQNDLSFHPGFHGIVEDQLLHLMAQGLILHFTGFSASALTIDSGGTIRLTGTPNSGCSHNPEPPPVAAPTRGLARVGSTIGKGEFVGDRNNVIPFDLIPEVKIDWITPTGAPVFMPFVPVIGTLVRGTELVRPQPLASGLDLPTGLNVSVELIRTATATCFSKPTRPAPDGG